MNWIPLICLITSIVLFLIIFKTSRRSSKWFLLVTLSVIFQIVAIWVFKLELLSWINLIFWFLFLVTLILLFISKKWYKRVAVLNSFWALVTIIALFIGQSFYPHSPIVQTQSPTVTSTVESTPIPTQRPVDIKAKDILTKKNNWPDKSVKIGTDIDPLKDRSEPGGGAFGKNFQNHQQIVDFLKKSGTANKALLKQLQESTGAKVNDLLNSNNWAVIQADQDFEYPANTYHSGGKVILAGQRAGKKGDIFFMFINPVNGKCIAIRGACANPQLIIPKPILGTPTPKPVITPTPVPTLKPKSGDPKDYKKPGDDKERDSGTGTKPIIPIVTSTAEPKPPVVVTDPGTVIIIITTPKPNVTPLPSTPKPPPETGVNPTAKPNATPSPIQGEPGSPWK